MNEMLGYVFGNLKITENAIRGVRRSLKEQKKFNRQVIVVLGALTGRMVLNEMVLNTKIKKMESEIKKLKTPKGE